MRLDPQDIEMLAKHIAQQLAIQITPEPSEPPVRLLDAAQLAAALGVRRDWVYRHAQQLGAIRLGGPAGRLRFDLQRAAHLLNQSGAESALPLSARRPRRALSHLDRGVDVLPAWSYGRRDHRSDGRATRQRPRP